MTTNATSDLEALGFTEYEARAYLALLQSGAQTGYQVAKASGIPRPNIYPVLARLVQRGAVNKVEAKGAARYTALPSDQMLRNVERSFSVQAQRARQTMAALEESQADEQIWNITGYDQILDRAQLVIDEAKHHLLVGVWSNESRRLGESIAAAEQRGVEITTLCTQGCSQECGGCTGRLYRYNLEGNLAPRTLIVVRDGEELLVGQCYSDGSARGATTRMPAFVSVATQFLENTIAVAEIARSLGPRLPRLLDDGARLALERTGVTTDETSWLSRLLKPTGRAK
jgi:predicted transcriptional regulator